MYIPSSFIDDIDAFTKINGNKSSRVICTMIKNFNNVNIRLHIPTIRKILKNNPEQRKYLKELLDESI